jgi:peptide/nickel transport system substrate-binding protein
MPDNPAYQAAHYQAQSIFAEELPALPLYLRIKLVVTRPDMCGVKVDPSADSALWNLESFEYGDGCAG